MAGEIYKKILVIKDRFFRLGAALSDLAPVRWILRHERHIASVLYVLWAAGCGYWIYWLITIDVKPQVSLLHIDEPRDALIMLFFGTLGSAVALLLAFFLLKFIYNLIHEGFDVVLPRRLYSFSKSVCWLIALNFAFLYGENIKTAGLIAYTQVNDIIQTSKRHEEIVEQDVSRLRELMEQLDKTGKGLSGSRSE